MVHIPLVLQPRSTSGPPHRISRLQTAPNSSGIHASASLPASPLELEEPLDELLLDELLLEGLPPSPLDEDTLPSPLDELVEPLLFGELPEEVPPEVLPLEVLPDEVLPRVFAAGPPSGKEMPQPKARPRPKKDANIK
jgi:hypothetical protein